MDPTSGIAHLRHEFALLQAALAAAAPGSAVPSCPEWTVADLTQHVAHVYLDKVACIRLNKDPGVWPPTGGESLDDAFGMLTAELTAHSPGHPGYSWYAPDQTVGFWIRRMAHETAIHRVDAELAAGLPVTPIDAELAADGIDEVLRVFAEYGSVEWPTYFAPVLAEADRRPVLIDAGTRAWTVTADPARIVVADAEPGSAAGSRLAGEADQLYLHLWSRGGEVVIGGEPTPATQLRTIMAPALQ